MLMDATFKYRADKDDVVIYYDINDPGEDMFALAQAIVKPGQNYYGLSFERLCQSVYGCLTVDVESRTAEITIDAAGFAAYGKN